MSSLLSLLAPGTFHTARGIPATVPFNHHLTTLHLTTLLLFSDDAVNDEEGTSLHFCEVPPHGCVVFASSEFCSRLRANPRSYFGKKAHLLESHGEIIARAEIQLSTSCIITGVVLETVI